MGRFKTWLAPALMIVVCCLASPPAARSATTQIIQEPTTPIPTACVVRIVKVGSPNLVSPTSYVYIDKFLDTNHLCNFVASNNADLCNPGISSSTNRLIASVTGANINMSPSCQWSCAGCGLIVTSAANDGLPVELMDFVVEDALGFELSEDHDHAAEREDR